MCSWLQEMYLTAMLTRKGGDPAPGASWGLRSRAVTPGKGKDKLKWHERLVMELPKGGTSLCHPKHLLQQHQGELDSNDFA